MDRRPALEKFKSIAARMNFIDQKLYEDLTAEEFQEASIKLRECIKIIRKIYGEKIAWEIECSAGEK